MILCMQMKRTYMILICLDSFVSLSDRTTFSRLFFFPAVAPVPALFILLTSRNMNEFFFFWWGKRKCPDGKKMRNKKREMLV